MNRLIFARNEDIVSVNINTDPSDSVYCYYEPFFKDLNSAKAEVKLDQARIYQLEKFIFEVSDTWYGDHSLPVAGINFLSIFELMIFEFLNPFLINLEKIKLLNYKGNQYPGGILLLFDSSLEMKGIKFILDLLDIKYRIKYISPVIESDIDISFFQTVKNNIKKFFFLIRNPFKRYRISKDKKVVMVCEHGGHSLTDSFIDKLICNRIYVLSAYPSLKLGLKYYWNKYYLPAKRYMKKEQSELRIKDAWKNPIIFEGNDISDFFYENLEKEFQKFYFFCRKNSENIDKRLNYLPQIKNCLILFDRAPALRVLIDLCHKHNISVSMIQHGVLARDVYPPVASDNYLIWGDYSQSIYPDHDHGDTRYYTVGTTNYETLGQVKSTAEENKREFYREFNIPEEKQLIIFATQTNDWYVEENESLIHINAIMEEFRKNSNREKYYIVIKVHPRDDEKLYERLVKEMNMSEDVLVLKWYDAIKLTSFSEKMIVSHSTLGLDALVLGKALFQINLIDYSIRLPFAEKGAAVYIDREKDIEKIFEPGYFNRNINQSDIDKLIKDFAYKLDGKTTERILKVFNNTGGTNE